jgi:hypothetical protein
MAGEINNLLVTDMEMLLKIPAPPGRRASQRSYRRRERRSAALL